jgi:hypothetical protein
MPCTTAAPTDSPKAAKEAVGKDEEKAEINSDSSLELLGLILEYVFPAW